MDKMEELVKKQLFYTKLICVLMSVLAVVGVLCLVLTVPPLTSVLKKTEAVLEKTDVLLEQIEEKSISDLNDTIQTLNQAIGPLKDFVILMNGGSDKDEAGNG